MSSGVLRVERGGSETKAPPLAARPNFAVSFKFCVNRPKLSENCKAHIAHEVNTESVF